jgi:hypothetical protein
MRCFGRGEEAIIACKLPEVLCFIVQEAWRERLSFEEQYKRKGNTDQD